MKKIFVEFAGPGFSGCPSLHFLGELLGDVVDPHGGLHGGEARSLLLFGARGQMLLEHGQLQCCHGVLGWPQVCKWGTQLSGYQLNGTELIALETTFIQTRQSVVIVWGKSIILC